MVYALPGIIMVVAYALMGCTLREVHLFPEMNDDTRQVQVSQSHVKFDSLTSCPGHG